MFVVTLKVKTLLLKYGVFPRPEQRQRAGAGAARVVVAKPGQDRYCTCCKSLHFFGGLFLNKNIHKTNWIFNSFYN